MGGMSIATILATLLLATALSTAHQCDKSSGQSNNFATTSVSPELQVNPKWSHIHRMETGENKVTAEGPNCCFYVGKDGWSDACQNRHYPVKPGSCVMESCKLTDDDSFLRIFIKDEDAFVLICNRRDIPNYKNLISDAPRMMKCPRGKYIMGKSNGPIPMTDGRYLVCVAERSIINGHTNYNFGAINCNRDNHKHNEWINVTKDTERILGDSSFMTDLAESVRDPPANETAKLPSLMDEVKDNYGKLLLAGAILTAVWAMVRGCLKVPVDALGNCCHCCFCATPKVIGRKLLAFPKAILRQTVKLFLSSKRGHLTIIPLEVAEMDSADTIHIVVNKAADGNDSLLLTRSVSLPIQPC